MLGTRRPQPGVPFNKTPPGKTVTKDTSTKKKKNKQTYNKNRNRRTVVEKNAQEKKYTKENLRGHAGNGQIAWESAKP